MKLASLMGKFELKMTVGQQLSKERYFAEILYKNKSFLIFNEN